MDPMGMVYLDIHITYMYHKNQPFMDRYTTVFRIDGEIATPR